MSQSPLVVEDLTVRVGAIEVVHQLSFALEAGQRTGLIGESGSGKTLTALAIMGLLAEGLSATGRVLYRGRDLLAMSERELCQVRGDRLAMVFQEPMTALNPVMKIGAQVAEPLRLHRNMAAKDATVQAQILNLLVELVEAEGSSLLLITHDLPVVANVCQRVLVLYGGYIVEEGRVDDVFSHPRHPYTQALLDAIPPLDEDLPSRKLKAIPGSVPGLGEFPPGCPFRNRCPRADAACSVMPALEGTDLRVACWHPLP